MSRHLNTLIAGTASAVLIGVGALPALASADDQARLDAAVEDFEQRLTDAGWVGEPADEDDDDEDDDEVLGDDGFTACFGELAAVLEGEFDDDEFPGQTAARESLEFTYSPEGTAPETTEGFSFAIGAEETVAVFAVSVDESGADLLDGFVETIGAKETGDCMREQMEAEMAADDDDEMLGEFEIAVENEADLGIGDRSSRLHFDFATNFMGMALAFDLDLYLARTGNDLAMLMYGTIGEPEELSGFDPLAELETIVDSLG